MYSRTRRAAAKTFTAWSWYGVPTLATGQEEYTQEYSECMRQRGYEYCRLCL